ncbi:hypothetical protein [Sulfitobacter geojensis]|uniref:hypothetical protein n=1 Tax=Sulfitobacter geojensis TaxID=1342299 RepID=UPI0024919A73|nr:hypothetical protein [Sulfitobacter geojensis]
MIIKISKSAFTINAVWWSFYVLTFAAIYFASEHLLSHYIYGDQQHYTNFYYAVRGARLAEVPILQYSKTGSAEPFYGYLIWLASNAGIEKTTLIANFNGLFAVLIAATIKKLNGSITLAVIMFTNYYFIVLITAAERLKFSYIVFCLAILVGGRWGRLLFFSSPLVHLQSVITIASVAFARLAEGFSDQKRRNWDRIKGFVGLSAVSLFGVFGFLRFQQRILGKYESYSELGEGVFGILQIIILATASIFIARKRIEAIFFFVPLIITAAILGGARVNMIGFVILFYIGLKDGKYFHPILLVLYFYFAYKSVGFVENILEFGVGYL